MTHFFPTVGSTLSALASDQDRQDRDAAARIARLQALAERIRAAGPTTTTLTLTATAEQLQGQFDADWRNEK